MPGRADAENSRGTHRLLREGAALCEGVSDVLAALEIELPEAPQRDDAEAGRTPAERALLAALAGRELHADELLDVTELAASVGLGALSALELRGAVAVAADGRYGRT